MFRALPPTPVRRSTIVRRAAQLIACTAAVFAVSAPAPAGAAEAGVALPGPEAGQAARVGTLGAHWVRMFLTWPDIEPARGVYANNWLQMYEASFHTLPTGTKVLLDVVDSPEWETGSTDEATPPANPADYASMLAAVAKRFGSRVAAYEIWNEEDEPRWWVGAPDPSGYTQLLKAAYPAVKAAEPHATVVLGGLTGNDYPFLEGVYAAGGRGSFDAVGVHTDTACNILSPYEYLRGSDNRMIPDSFLAYREVHAVMEANGDDKPIWMTEMSWRTTSAVCSEGAWAGQKAAGVSEQQQALYLRQAYHCLAQDPYVQVAMWFPLVDQGGVTSGLIRENGSHKPAYEAMREYIRSGDTLKEECGVFEGPKISVASPSNHISYSGPLPIDVSASSKVGVFRIRLEIDGRLIRNYDGKTYPRTLSGRLEWQGAKHISFGRHTLTFLAYDRMRNVSTRSITIIHTRHAPESLSGYDSGPSKPHSKKKKKHSKRRRGPRAPLARAPR
jgi:Cellulase (glycosyl hydrolase family 5)